MDSELWGLLREFGPTTVLVFLVLGAMKRVYVLRAHHDEVVDQWKHVYDQMKEQYEGRLNEANLNMLKVEQDRDYWRDYSVSALQTADRVSDVAVKVTDRRKSER